MKHPALQVVPYPFIRPLPSKENLLNRPYFRCIDIFKYINFSPQERPPHLSFLILERVPYKTTI